MSSMQPTTYARYCEIMCMQKCMRAYHHSFTKLCKNMTYDANESTTLWLFRIEHWNMLPSRHHGKSSIGQLGSKFALACLRVLDLTQEVGESNTIVAWLTSLSRVLHAELTLTRTTSTSGGRRLEESSCLNQTGKGDDLSTTKHRQP